MLCISRGVSPKQRFEWRNYINAKVEGGGRAETGSNSDHLTPLWVTIATQSRLTSCEAKQHKASNRAVVIECEYVFVVAQRKRLLPSRLHERKQHHGDELNSLRGVEKEESVLLFFRFLFWFIWRSENRHAHCTFIHIHLLAHILNFLIFTFFSWVMHEGYLKMVFAALLS